ncbi:zinc finger protein Gfi-1-like isoform X3 [Anguilla rostrata]|uniref:zinc finger protein Gfi-1-like isoform X3 n=1 Tax=Anguilla rostrata TaxID=7938 RepID=UPI0030D5D297
MSNCVAFHTQIASIMEVLANAAVAEICKLVDDGYAVLRLEMSQSQKENESLRRKLQVLELRVAQACNFAEKTRTKDSSVNNRPKRGSVFDKFQGSTTAESDSTPSGQSLLDTGLLSDGEPTAEDQCADMEEGRTESVLIKEERVEEERDPQGEMNSREERLVEPSLDDGKLAAALGNRSPPSKGREEESDQQRSRRHVWEPTAVEEEEGCEPLPVKEERLGEEGSSSEARGGARSCGERAVERGGATVGGRVPALNTQTAPVRPLEELAEHSAPSGLWELQGFRTGGMQKARKGRSGLGLRHGGADLRPGGRSSLDSEFVLYERAGQLGSYCTQGGAVAETEDPCCSYSAESDPESLTFRSELQRGPPADGGSGSSLPSLGYLDWKPEAAVVETVKMEAEARSVWNRPVVSRAGHTHPKNYDDDDDDGDGENIHAENIADVCPPFSRMRAGVGGVRDEPSAGAADLNGCGLLRKSFGASVGLGTERRFEAGGGGVYRDSGEAGGLSGPLQMGERQFSCTQCGKLFAHPGRLKVHQRVHTGEKPFSCAQCGKRFAQSSHIKRHQRVHTGEKPFSCTQCGKSFSHLCNLKTHQTVHTGERPYSCTQCGKNFSSLGNLIRHQSVHIGK